MSKYTTELRYICESVAGLDKSVGYNDVATVIAKARPNIFNFGYPIFDERYKPTLETKIIKHFYTREIAFETVGLWRLKLDTRMNEIMPFYNKLYESVGIEFDPLENVNYTRTYSRDISGNENTSGSSDNRTSHNNLSTYLDTPQGNIELLLNGEYLTSGNNVTGSARSGQTAESQRSHGTIEGFGEHVKGKQGGDSYAKMLMEYRDTILNIDMMVIKDLEQLFLLLW